MQNYQLKKGTTVENPNIYPLVEGPIWIAGLVVCAWLVYDQLSKRVDREGDLAAILDPEDVEPQIRRNLYGYTFGLWGAAAWMTFYTWVRSTIVNISYKSTWSTPHAYYVMIRAVRAVGVRLGCVSATDDVTSLALEGGSDQKNQSVGLYGRVTAEAGSNEQADVNAIPIYPANAYTQSASNLLLSTGTFSAAVCVSLIPMLWRLKGIFYAYEDHDATKMSQQAQTGSFIAFVIICSLNYMQHEVCKFRVTLLEQPSWFGERPYQASVAVNPEPADAAPRQFACKRLIEGISFRC